MFSLQPPSIQPTNLLKPPSSHLLSLQQLLPTLSLTPHLQLSSSLPWTSPISLGHLVGQLYPTTRSPEPRSSASLPSVPWTTRIRLQPLRILQRHFICARPVKNSPNYNLCINQLGL